MPVPRLRVFAGPNGSGKSTIKDQIPSNLICTYVNADEIEKEARASGFVDLSQFNVTTTQEVVRKFFAEHSLLQKIGLQDQARLIGLNNQQVDFRGVQMSSYYASVISDFIRHNLLIQTVNFTFETVMSFKDKVEFMRLAQANGYRTYLYFVATESPKSTSTGLQTVLMMAAMMLRKTRSSNVIIARLSFFPRPSRLLIARIFLITPEKKRSCWQKSRTALIFSSTKKKYLTGLCIRM